jgi:hypothetical protein
MAIVPLTLTISLCLVFTFIIFFLREHARGRLSSAERDSLMPLADETPLLATSPAGRASQDRTPRRPVDHDEQDCGCRDGARPPCAGCVKRHDTA